MWDHPSVYKLKDYEREELQGRFYEVELQKIIKQSEVYEIEKILKIQIWHISILNINVVFNKSENLANTLRKIAAICKLNYKKQAENLLWLRETPISMGMGSTIFCLGQVETSIKIFTLFRLHFKLSITETRKIRMSYQSTLYIYTF